MDYTELQGSTMVKDAPEIINNNFASTSEATEALDTKTSEAIDKCVPSVNLIDLIYPVGSVYISVSDASPETLFGKGTWELISQGRCIMGADDNHTVGTTIEAGLPNITGKIRAYSEFNFKNYDFITSGVSGAFYWTQALEDGQVEDYPTSTNMASGTNDTIRNVPFDASKSNAIYGNSDTVQPPTYYVNMWKRTA